MEKFWLSHDPITINDCIDNVIQREAGAISTFIGVVREFTRGKRTLFLEYDAYVPMATKQLAKIGEEIQEKWPDAEVSIAHRLGRLDISDDAVTIAVTKQNSDESFKACSYEI